MTLRTIAVCTVLLGFAIVLVGCDEPENTEFVDIDKEKKTGHEHETHIFAARMQNAVWYSPKKYPKFRWTAIKFLSREGGRTDADCFTTGSPFYSDPNVAGGITSVQYDDVWYISTGLIKPEAVPKNDAVCHYESTLADEKGKPIDPHTIIHDSK